MKKLISFLIIFSLIMVLPSVTASAGSVEDYTLSKLNDKVDIYHITSQKQIEKGIKGGEGAQLVYSMAVSPHNSDLVLLGNNTTGIFRSTDGGKNWVHSSEGLYSPCIDSIAFDPDDENIAYAVVATGSNSSKRISQGVRLGLYKSYDAGKTWQFKLYLCNERSIGRLIAFGQKDNTGSRPMYAASSYAADYETLSKGTTGLWRSYDKGETWECAGLEDRSIMTLYCDKNMLAVVSDKGIDISTDNGKTFVSANGDLPYVSTSAFTVNPENPDHWTVGSRFEFASGRCGGMLYETFNRGVNWTPVNNEYYGYESTTYICSLDYIYPEGKTTPRLLMAIYRTSQPNRYSDDYGKTFKKCNLKVAETYGLYKEFNGYFSLPFCINPNNSNEIFTSMIVPYKSVDGGETFEYSASGYSGMATYDFDFAPNGAVRYAAITDVGFATMDTNAGTVFSPSYGISDITNTDYATEDSSTALAVDPEDPMHGFATMGGWMYGNPATLLETTDGFKTLKPMASFEQLNETKQRLVSKVWYHPTDNNTVYTDYYVSEDNGVSWKEINHPIKGVSPFDGNTVYSLDNYEVFISRDRGNTWTATDITVTPRGKYEAFCVDLFYEDVIWTGDFTYLYRIDIANNHVDVYDGGKTKFVGITGNDLELTGLVQNPELKNHLVLSARDLAEGGSFVFESFDYGANWEKLDCFPYLAHDIPIEFHPTEKLLFFGGMMGTLVYHWDKSSWYMESELTDSGYDFVEERYTLTGHTDSGYYNSPVTMALTDKNGNTDMYFTTTDAVGNFGFDADIPVNSGEFDVKVSFLANEEQFSSSFTTDEPLSPKGKFRAVYNPETENFVICGNSENNETVSFLLKDKRYDISGISDAEFLHAVKYIGEITPDKDGDYVYKFRFDIPEGMTSRNFDINVLTDSAVYENIPVENISGKDYNFKITANSNDKIDFTPGAKFSLNVKWRYFFENKLDTCLGAAFYDKDGRLTGVYLSERTMEYDVSSDSISGTVPKSSVSMKVFMWSDLCPLEGIKEYR